VPFLLLPQINTTPKIHPCPVYRYVSVKERRARELGKCFLCFAITEEERRARRINCQKNNKMKKALTVDIQVRENSTRVQVNNLAPSKG
jgi:hypothetical protein